MTKMQLGMELLRRAEAVAICELLRIDCHGRKQLKAKALRRAETLAELLRATVKRDAAKRSL